MRRTLMTGITLAALAAPPALAQSLTFAINNLGAETWWPQDISQNKYISSNIGDPLIRLAAPYSLEPALATGWAAAAPPAARPGRRQCPAAAAHPVPGRTGRSGRRRP